MVRVLTIVAMMLMAYHHDRLEANAMTTSNVTTGKTRLQAAPDVIAGSIVRVALIRGRPWQLVASYVIISHFFIKGNAWLNVLLELRNFEPPSLQRVGTANS